MTRSVSDQHALELACRVIPDEKMRDPLPKEGLKGSLHQEWKRCGKSNCRCRTGALHGPYYYLRQRVAGRQKKVYIARKDVPSALLSIEARRWAAQEMRQLERSLRRRRKGMPCS